MSYFIIFEKTFISNKYTCASYMTLEHFLKLLQWSNKLWHEITTVHIIIYNVGVFDVNICQT